MTNADFRGGTVALEDVTHQYGSHVALRDVSLEVSAGEFVTLLGPSGSGKTTTLSLLSGFTVPTVGRVLIDGTDVTHTPAHRRNVGVVFQNYALFPHMTVLQNVMFPLRVRHVARKDAAERAQAALRIVQLEQMVDRLPRQLSGGQQQRVALARALVYEPPVLLMDEPFGALDRRLREDMQLNLRRLHRQLGVTIIFVTHDQEEALTLSDRVVVLHDGRIEQSGAPSSLYEAPETEFVASFLGSSNLLQIDELVTTAHGCECRTPSGLRLRLSQKATSTETRLVLRPERIRILAPDDDARIFENTVLGDVDDAIFLGDGSNYLVRLETGDILLVKDVNRGQRPSGRVRLAWRNTDVVVLRNDAERAAQTARASELNEAQVPAATVFAS